MANKSVVFEEKLSNGVNQVYPLSSIDVLPCIHTKNGSVHTFTSTIPIVNLGSIYTVRAKVISDFAKSDTLKLVTSNVTYQNIILSNAQDKEFVANTIITIQVNAKGGTIYAFI